MLQSLRSPPESTSYDIQLQQTVQGEQSKFLLGPTFPLCAWLLLRTSHTSHTANEVTSIFNHHEGEFGCCSVRARLQLNICNREAERTAQGLLGADLLVCSMLLLHPVDKDHMLSIKQRALSFLVLGAKSGTTAQETAQGLRQNLCLYLTEQSSTQQLWRLHKFHQLLPGPFSYLPALLSSAECHSLQLWSIHPDMRCLQGQTLK